MVIYRRFIYAPPVLLFYRGSCYNVHTHVFPCELHTTSILRLPFTFRLRTHFISHIYLPYVLQLASALPNMRWQKMVFFVFCIYACAYNATCMHQKRGVAEHLQRMPETKRFRADVTNLFLSNQLPGDRTLGLLQNAELAGARNVSNLTKSYRAKPPCVKNASRDLRRRMVKHCVWPKPYYVEIDCLDVKTGGTKKMWVPMWLPHEIVHCLENASKGGLILANAQVHLLLFACGQ